MAAGAPAVVISVFMLGLVRLRILSAAQLRRTVAELGPGPVAVTTVGGDITTAANAGTALTAIDAKLDVMVKERVQAGQPDTPELRAAVRDELNTRELLVREALNPGLHFFEVEGYEVTTKSTGAVGSRSTATVNLRAQDGVHSATASGQGGDIDHLVPAGEPGVMPVQTVRMNALPATGSSSWSG